MHVLCCLPVQFTEHAAVVEGRGKRAGEGIQRSGNQYAAGIVSQKLFAIHEIKQFVFDDSSTYVTAILRTLELGTPGIRCGLRVVAEQAKCFPVNRVRSRGPSSIERVETPEWRLREWLSWLCPRSRR